MSNGSSDEFDWGEGETSSESEPEESEIFSPPLSTQVSNAYEVLSTILLFEIHTWIANHIGTDTAGATLTACAIRTHAFWIGALF